MNNVSRSLILAGSGNQVPPGPPPKVWRPFFQNYNLNVTIGIGMNGYYPGDFVRHSLTGLSANDIKPQTGEFLTEEAYLNYLKTIHPLAHISTKDGAFNSVVSLDFGFGTTNDQSGWDFGGQFTPPANGYLFYEKNFAFSGISPAGNYSGRVVTYIFYKLMDPT